MIKNKIIKISMANEFDRGWTLFRPFVPSFNAEKYIEAISPATVIPKITKAERINIVLAEKCLSSGIVRELEWVSKYIPIYLIAGSEQIASFYSSRFKIADLRIDSDISLNYLAILSNEPFYVLIGEGYAEVDSALNDVYFGNKGITSFDCSGITEVYAIGTSVDSDTTALIKSFNGASINYVIPKDAYGKSVYDTFKNSENSLLVGIVYRKGIVAVDKAGALFRLHRLGSGMTFKEKIFDIGSFAGGLYKCELFDEKIDYSLIAKELYVWDNGVLAPIAIESCITVKKSVQMDDMHSFINEEFDRSVTDSHNDHSGKAERVEYVFELIPPVLPHNAQPSELYSELSGYLKEWKALKSSVFKRCAAEILNITDTSVLYGICLDFQTRNDRLVKAISDYDFDKFSAKLSEFKSFLEEAKKNLLSYMGEIYASVGTASDSGKFDKFDAEIAGYEQTIAEKQALVDQKIEVLSNKRRIDILQKKINELRGLKAKFENNSGERTDKAVAVFISKCQGYLNGNQKRENDDSLGNIVKTKEESKEMLLDAFASGSLCVLNEQLEKYLLVINKMRSVDIPDDYTVYDADGKRMIVIGEIGEFDRTKAIREKYNLNCVVRR